MRVQVLGSKNSTNCFKFIYIELMNFDITNVNYMNTDVLISFKRIMFTGKRIDKLLLQFLKLNYS